MRVSPFRHLRIKGYLPSPFRRTSRLSSALSAKASTICSFSSMTKRTAAHGRRLASYVGIALPALASRHFFYSLPRIWFVMNNRFRDYLGCLDLDILLDHFVFPCMRFSRYICDARRASSGEYEIRTVTSCLQRQALSPTESISIPVWHSLPPSSSNGAMRHSSLCSKRPRQAR